MPSRAWVHCGTAIAGQDLGVVGSSALSCDRIVKKNAIMMIDFALYAEREQRLPPREAIHPACCCAFVYPVTTFAALFGPCHDARHRAGTSWPPAGVTMVGA